MLANTKLCKAFANGSSANAKLSEPQVYKTGQIGGFLSRYLEPLLKSGLSLIGKVLKPLLIPLGLTETASVTDVAIHKKTFGSDNVTLIISNKEMNDIMKLINSLEESGLLIKGISETIKKEAKTIRRTSWNVIRHFWC